MEFPCFRFRRLESPSCYRRPLYPGNRIRPGVSRQLARAPNSGERKRGRLSAILDKNVDADWGSFQLGHDGIYADIGTQTSLFRVTSCPKLPSSGKEGQNGDSYVG